MLQALEMLSHDNEELTWIKALYIRETVADLLEQSVDRFGDAQWIGHILKRLHLINEGQRKRGVDGISYFVRRADVLDMMRRYNVTSIEEMYTE